jgi:hypothetical protein
MANKYGIGNPAENKKCVMIYLLNRKGLQNLYCLAVIKQGTAIII